MEVTITKDAASADVITHGGVFHADDVLATVILGKVFGKIAVCRVNRMPEHYNKEAIVYDIGGGAYDHHQKGGNGVRANGVPYASSGLIWEKFGRRLTENADNPEKIWEQIDQELIQGIDAVDNGVMPVADYPAQCLSLPSLIGMQNPTWDGKNSPDEAFIGAVALAEIVFDSVFQNAVSKAAAEMYVEEAIAGAQNHIMVLERYMPWDEMIFHSANKKAEDIHYVVYPSIRGGYNWQCVPDVLHGFGQRKPVPQKWWGKHQNELQELTGIKTAVFCHPNGFIGSAETFADAYALAELAENADEREAAV